MFEQGSLKIQALLDYEKCFQEHYDLFSVEEEILMMGKNSCFQEEYNKL